MKRRAALAFFAALLAAACTAPVPEPIDPEAHRRVVEQWRQWRHEQLIRPDGWLSLAGLYWLDEGSNSFGAAAQSDLVVEVAGVPESLGSFERQGEQVEFVAADGVQVTLDGEPVTRVAARTGEPDEQAPVLQWDRLSWYVLERGGRIGVRMRDARNRVLVEFSGIDSYPIDPRWRIVGRLEPYDPPRMIKVPNILGTLNDVESPAAAVFEVDGGQYRMDLWRDSPGDEDWFTAFADETNGAGTYGGGRFIRIDPPDEHGRLVIDFNRAYNPPCVFTPFATCPLPPRQNRLGLDIRAGEKNFAS